MNLEEVKNKKIGNFADNSSDNYRGKDSITFEEMLKKYLNNTGFFVIIDDENKLKGYFDMEDIGLMKPIHDKFDDNKHKTIKQLIDEGRLKLRTSTIDYNEKVIDVLKRLSRGSQNYYPVMKEGMLIGRISRKILKEKIDELY